MNFVILGFSACRVQVRPESKMPKTQLSIVAERIGNGEGRREKKGGKDSVYGQEFPFLRGNPQKIYGQIPIRKVEDMIITRRMWSDAISLQARDHKPPSKWMRYFLLT